MNPQNVVIQVTEGDIIIHYYSYVWSGRKQFVASNWYEVLAFIIGASLFERGGTIYVSAHIGVTNHGN